MNSERARVALARMEACLAATHHTLDSIERRLRSDAVAKTIIERAKSRQYGRHPRTWTSADEAVYRRILTQLTESVGAELHQLRRKAQRQDAAICALRRKYGVNIHRRSAYG